MLGSGVLLWARHYGRPGRRRASGLLFVAILLHNSEEGIAYPATRPEATHLLRQIWPALQLPPPAVFQGALLLLTIVVGAMLSWAAMTRDNRGGWLVVRVTASVLLANVMVPHIPAAILLGGYAPGVVTAVALNLPLGLWILCDGASRRRSADR